MAPKRSLVTRWRALALAVLAAAAILAALLGLAGRESVARWAAGQAVSASKGQLAIEGVQGSLYGPLRIARLSWETPEQRIELHGLALDWSPRLLLLQRQVRLHQAALRSLRIELKKPSAEPLRLPVSLHLPVGVEIPALSVARLEIQNQDSRHELRDLSAGLSYGAGRYRLSLDRAATPWGAAKAGLDLGESRPFALDGQVSLQKKEGSHPYAARVTLKGSLQKLAASATATAGRMEAGMESVWLPFEPVFLQQASLHGRHLDPAWLDAGWPAADIGMALSLRGSAADTFQGRLRVENRLPGAIDQARLPLKTAVADLTGKLDDLGFTQLHLDLGEGGQFTGGAEVKGRRLGLDLATRNFNLQGVQSKLKPTQLAGKVRIDAEEEAQRIYADLRQRHYEIRLDARQAARQLELKTATIRAYASELQLSGGMALAGDKAFKAEGAIKRFNPADFGKYPAAAINGRFAASGRLSPQWQAAIEFSLSDSQFRGHPLAAKGKVHASSERIWDSAVEARLAQNRLSASGAFGRAGDRLEWRLKADKLSVIGPEFGGQAQATGTLEGTPDQPSGAFELTGRQLRWTAQHQVQRVRASGRLDKGLEGTLALNAEIDGYRSNGFRLDKASAAGRGRRGGHVLTLHAHNPALDMHAELAGGWNDKNGWTGELRQFRNQGDYPVVLRAPAPLALGPEQWRLRNAELGFADGTVSIHEIARKGAQFTSRGQFDKLALAQAQKLVDPSLGIETSLRFGGHWSVTADDQVNGTLSISRENGDISMPTEPRTNLGLSRLALKLEAVNSRVTGTLDAAGTPLGVISANAATEMTRKNGAWGVAGSTAVRLEADATIPSLAWLAPLLDPTSGTSTDGSVRARLRADGTLQNPGLTGVISASGLKVEVPDQGLYLKDGQLRAELQQGTLRLTQWVMRAGEGQIAGQGSLLFGGAVPVMQLKLTANKLEVLARPDRHLVLSGMVDAAATGREVQLTAKLKADRGLIELPKTDAPALSDDVVVLGRDEKRETKASPYRTRMDLALDLGDDFHFKGKGLDAQLGGAIRIRAADGKPPQANGSIRVIKGAYSAYGQRLAIDRGILNFSGPIDNPGLNIIAMRKNRPVEAGVAVTGTALQPRVRLVSNPSVPDSEKLSWLVLGHGMENTGGSEFRVLQAAAGALLAAGESVSLQSRIAHAAGLDQLGLSGAGGLESSVLTMGQRLSAQAYLSFEQGLLGTGTLVKINYTLTKRLSVRTQTGTDNAVDLFYTFAFN